MNDVKWIKLATNLFDNRKIKQIRKMPEGDAIIVIWTQILCLAGITNDGGFIYFAKDIPYTEDMLAVEFDRNINVIKLALRVLESFKMIEVIDNILLVSNWEKYQSTEKLAKIREQRRIRQQRFRAKTKELALENSNVTVTHDVTQHNALDKELDKELDIDIDIDIDSISEDKSSTSHSKKDNFDWKSFQERWNNNSGLGNIRQMTNSRKTAVNARLKEYDLETIYKVIDKCKESDFLQGKIKSNRVWVATFDWVFSPKNFIKILEGNYDNKETSKPSWYSDYEKEAKEYENKNKSEMTKEEKDKVFEDAKKIFSNLIKGE